MEISSEQKDTILINIPAFIEHRFLSRPRIDHDGPDTPQAPESRGVFGIDDLPRRAALCCRRHPGPSRVGDRILPRRIRRPCLRFSVPPSGVRVRSSRRRLQRHASEPGPYRPRPRPPSPSGRSRWSPAPRSGSRGCAGISNPQ